MIILKEIWETQKWHQNLVGQALLDQNMEKIVLINELNQLAY